MSNVWSGSNTIVHRYMYTNQFNDCLITLKFIKVAVRNQHKIYKQVGAVTTVEVEFQLQDVIYLKNYEYMGKNWILQNMEVTCRFVHIL